MNEAVVKQNTTQSVKDNTLQSENDNKDKTQTQLPTQGVSSSPVDSLQTETAAKESTPTNGEIEEIQSSSNEKEGNSLSTRLDNIIQVLPKRMKNRARLITSYLQGKLPIDLNDNGEVTLNGIHYPGTSIQDLIYDSVSPRRTYVPTSAKHFYNFLKANNIPKGLVLNKARHKWLTHNKLTKKQENKINNWVPY